MISFGSENISDTERVSRVTVHADLSRFASPQARKRRKVPATLLIKCEASNRGRGSRAPSLLQPPLKIGAAVERSSQMPAMKVHTAAASGRKASSLPK